MLERLFKLTENHTTVQRELLGGLTTFITMAYIIVVNPRILAEGGMPIEGVVFATCVSAAVATLVMGLWANYPIALAPGMSLNAYFTYSIVIGRGIPWTTALGVVFFSGLLFLVLTLTRVREQVVNGIPDCLKHGTAAGIGLFIAFVGLRSAKLVVAHPATFVALGSFSDPQLQVATFGLVLTAALMARRISDPARHLLDHGGRHPARPRPVAKALRFSAAPVGHLTEARSRGRRSLGFGGADLCLLLCGSLR